MLRYVLRAGVGILLLQVLCGCNPHVQRYSPYKDIFPDGYVIENESNSADLKEFKKSTLAIIPSANLERHVVAWKNLYEKGGVDAAKAQSRVFVGLLRTIKPIETAGLSDSGMDQGWKNNQQLTSPENILDKFYSIIVAVILVIAGFFGFKNITEIKQRAIEDAQDSSKKIAEETAIDSSRTQFERIFTKEYEGQILKISTGSFSKILDDESTKLNRQIILLQNRIEQLEGNQINNELPDQEQVDEVENNNEPLNPFDHE